MPDRTLALAGLLSFACSPGPSSHLPVEGPPVTLLVSDPERSEVARAGVLTIAFRVPGDESWALEVRGDGTLAWALLAEPGLRYGRARYARDGSVLLMEGLPEGAGPVGRVVRWTPEAGELASTDAPSSHHDVVELDDGRLAWLSHRFATAELPPVGEAPVVGDRVEVAEEGGVSEVIIDTLDDYPVPPWWICSHNALGRRIEGYHDLLHTNSLVPDPSDGGWLLMERYLDAILKFDASGTFQWQLGGRDSTLVEGEGAAFAHAHFTWAEGDRLLVFDNGPEHGTLAPSRVVELAVDPATGRSERIWEHIEPSGAHVRYLGDARRLPGGNTLIAWGALGRISEITPSGEEVWAIDVGMAVGRVELSPR